MKKRKKWVSLMLAAMLCMGSLAGCGDKAGEEQNKGQDGTQENEQKNGGEENKEQENTPENTPGEKTPEEDNKEEEKKYDLGGRTVTIGHWNNITPNPNSATYMERMELIAEIEEEFNCTLEFVTPNDYHLYRRQILLSAMSNEKYADIFYLSGEDIPSWVNNNFLMPLDGIVDLDSESWNPQQVEQWAFNGKHYFVTSEKTGMGAAVLFNKRICEENGISSEYLYDLQAKKEWTWEKLLELTQKCTKVVNGEYVSYGLGSYGAVAAFPEFFMTSNGVTPAIYDENGMLTNNLSNPDVMEALQFAYDLVHTYKVCYTGGWDWGTWEQLWKEGKTAFFMCEAWQIDQYWDVLAEDQFGILMLPIGPKSDDYKNFRQVASGMVIPACEEDPEAIGAIIDKYYYEYDWVKQNRKTTREVWEVKVFDEESLTAIEWCDEPERTIVRIGDANSWFQGNILWGNYGINSQTPPRTWVEEISPEINKAFADANTLPDKEALEEEISNMTE